jgi:L-galactose dehydrogenase
VEDLSVSALGYGAAPLGDVYGQVDPRTGIRSVRAALELGVTVFDVSPYYGRTRAETVLGQALTDVDRVLAPVLDHTWPSGRPENSEPR